MCESMVERVARAIAREMCDTEFGWENWLPTARAAIEAMREPTDAMIDVGADSIDAEMCWKGMIDAALNEQVAG